MNVCNCAETACVHHCLPLKIKRWHNFLERTLSQGVLATNYAPALLKSTCYDIYLALFTFFSFKPLLYVTNYITKLSKQHNLPTVYRETFILSCTNSIQWLGICYTFQNAQNLICTANSPKLCDFIAVYLNWFHVFGPQNHRYFRFNTTWLSYLGILSYVLPIYNYHSVEYPDPRITRVRHWAEVVPLFSFPSKRCKFLYLSTPSSRTILFASFSVSLLPLADFYTVC